MHVFIPGRLLLIGDHSDWVGSFNRGIDTVCIEILLSKGIHASISKSDKFEFYYKDQSIVSELNSEHLEKIAKSKSFFRYVAGTAFYFYKFGGLKIKITKMDLPIGKGLASSATICALVATAYNKFYNLGYSPDDIMRFAFLGETLTGSKCGRGDQIGSYVGNGRVFKLVFNNENVTVTPIKIFKPFYFLIADVKGNKNTPIICNDLQKAFVEHDEVREFLETDNAMLCDSCIKALVAGDAELLGSYMKKGLALFDKKMAPHSWEQLESLKLHAIANDSFILDNSYGSKGTGAQGDGAIQILCKDKKSVKSIKKYLSEEFHLDDFEVLVLKP